ncbi:MAG TPA: DUF1553 domain-containing protein [Pirellulales bacterium]|nr:DUF1553 domain-containing protein [Pirellulales bacterium]
MRLLVLAAAAIYWMAPCCAIAAAPGEESPGSESPAERNRQVRSLLSDTCFKCHGPDAAGRKAELRLDQRDAAVAAGAITPGKPDESELIARILEEDDELRMPPPEANKTLTAEQKQLLRRWIAEGAEYASHWSFIPLAQQIDPPAVDDPQHWAAGEIDQFVLARLRQAGIEPAEPATREKWLRRASFDLTGLPPTLAEIDAILADRSPEAFEKVVDRLLASEAFGERMTADWLDAARYGDTFGYQSDREMHVWPWRDWVIRAFNANLPYRDFIVWQTAGDMLPGATREQRLATTFNRLHRQTNEGGSIDAEFRNEYVSDRVHTNGTAFLGLTLECCRCHEHKYDPITQKDYYRLGAFFSNIDESGLYSHFTETAPTPTMLLYEGDQEAKHRELLEQIRQREAALDALIVAARSRFEAAGQPHDEPLPELKPDAAFRFDDVQPQGDKKPVPGKVGQALGLGGDDAFTCGDAGAFGRTTPFSFSLWVKPALQKPRMIVFHRSRAAEDSAFRGYSLALDDGHPTFSLVHFWPGNAIQVRAHESIPNGDWTHLVVAYDGGSHAAGVKLYAGGRPVECEVVRDKLARDITHRAEWGDSDVNAVKLALGARFRDVGFEDGAVDEFEVFNRELTPLEAARLGGFEGDPGEGAYFSHYLLRRDEPYRAAREELAELRRQENELVGQVRQIMVMEEMSGRRPAYVLLRGAYDARGEQVEPGAPAGLFAMPEEYPRNRLGFAQWLVDERNPLTARVAVNRFWQIFFGRGLVATPEDFGGQGRPPTHPELLDWLARRFIDSGWDVKALCKLIALSSVYRQSSTPRERRLFAEDPENRLLARGPRHRLSAEQIRDNALAASGLLAPKIGGPSVKPYQPAGLWEESGTGKTYVQDHGEGLYRRSMYTFWRRTAPPASMRSFDAGSREICAARREQTATPLQSLVLLNDPQFIEAARVLAEKLMLEHGSLDEQLQTAFRLLTSRAASAEELAVLKRLRQEQLAQFAAAPESAQAFLQIGERPRDAKLDAVEHAALTVVALALMNHDECVTKR